MFQKYLKAGSMAVLRNQQKIFLGDWATLLDNPECAKNYKNEDFLVLVSGKLFSTAYSGRLMYLIFKAQFM